MERYNIWLDRAKSSFELAKITIDFGLSALCCSHKITPRGVYLEPVYKVQKNNHHRCPNNAVIASAAKQSLTKERIDC